MECATSIALSDRRKAWLDYLVSGPVASAEFMERLDELTLQEREQKAYPRG
ncbi:hypothetical protein SAMN05421770_10917 [Granulicella rosea]|uniref:Uncharacterized protein n=1 Tax=Granulicella rosea TaxID=474952 RepID=A0A239M2S6_9BACT|nr:hypothetical protein SAMN05421770_10917 [Granulicella rosea]